MLIHGCDSGRVLLVGRTTACGVSSFTGERRLVQRKAVMLGAYCVVMADVVKYTVHHRFEPCGVKHNKRLSRMTHSDGGTVEFLAELSEAMDGEVDTALEYDCKISACSLRVARLIDLSILLAHCSAASCQLYWGSGTCIVSTFSSDVVTPHAGHLHKNNDRFCDFDDYRD